MFKTIEKINKSVMLRSVAPLFLISSIVMAIQPFLLAWRWFDIKIFQEKVVIAQLEKKIKEIQSEEFSYSLPVEETQPSNKKRWW